MCKDCYKVRNWFIRKISPNLAVSNVDINFFAVCLKKFHRDTEVVDAILNRTTEFIRKISAVCTVKIFTKS